ncbi:hypothetical protein C8N36_106228 [Pelagimonas varians]|uniref:Uncharacterized protein n=1 Tax=Pelagimonas varians TaxID=696760 RepID=A0A238K388_9RHOB|nr:hypothetical protein C8N36_106228 [Pelagimonas varians]SMX37391.1 hypothetical protein PEV8663_01062 [Pelagimonas varians]
MRFNYVVVLGVAHWVGAITRHAEGSYMQLQDQCALEICLHCDAGQVFLRRRSRFAGYF